jgi:hypothetical protein
MEQPSDIPPKNTIKKRIIKTLTRLSRVNIPLTINNYKKFEMFPLNK